MQGEGTSSVEVGTPVQGKAINTVSAAGAVTLTYGQHNLMANGVLMP